MPAVVTTVSVAAKLTPSVITSERSVTDPPKFRSALELVTVTPWLEVMRLCVSSLIVSFPWPVSVVVVMVLPTTVETLLPMVKPSSSRMVEPLTVAESEPPSI